MQAPPRRDRLSAPQGRRGSIGSSPGDQPPVDQNSDLVGEGEHGVHIVLDQQHRVFVLKGADQLDAGACLLGAEAGEGLVQQHQTRAQRERHRDLEQRFSPCESSPAGSRARAQKPDALERRPRRPVQRVLPRDASEKAKARPERACTASATLSSALNSGSTAAIWNDRARPSSARAGMSSRVMSSSSKTILPASDCSSAGELVDQRRLACPVGANQCNRGGLRQREMTSSATTSAPNRFAEPFNAQRRGLIARLPTAFAQALPPVRAGRRARR